ncbi:hypothetical protein H5410_006527 [Solanum commersonii]|uniref:Uncharacterized protein n=1 Tax=Solanum commersonii TaxID=4109 RepID=A0A9J6A9L3_SOLCO|nr:hypothetical protein H5410_006527 [Solanum commersonii]
MSSPKKNRGYIDGDINISISQEARNACTYFDIVNVMTSIRLILQLLRVISLLKLVMLPQDVDKNNVKMFVEEVMELVELTPLRSP